MADPAGGAGSLPEPPPRHPFRSRLHPAGEWVRIHDGRFGATQFNDTVRGDGRFSPLVDPATGAIIPVLYAAATGRGAIAEILFHDAPMPSTGFIYDWERDRTGPLCISTLQLGRLRLVDLTTLGLRAAGLTVADLFGTERPDYPRTRRWALYLHASHPDAQGLRWMSARDNSTACVMLFGDRIRPTDCMHTGHTRPVSGIESEVFNVLDALGGALALP